MNAQMMSERTSARRPNGRPAEAAIAGLSRTWTPPLQTRILDMGARDGRLAEALAAQGLDHYLAFVDPARLPGVRSAAGRHASRFQLLNDLSIVRRCSADLLVLRAEQARVAWGWGELGHFRWLAVERAAGQWESRLATRIAASRGRLTPRGEWIVPGAGAFDLFEIDRIVEREARIYFSPAWGAEGLAQRLAEAGIDYAVLRWFDTLPAIEPGEDLDVLVSDADSERFRSLVETEPGTLPIDLYSVSGLDGSDFRGAAYYVPQLAEQILANARVHHSGMRVPSDDDHLHSLAYHAVYHKGGTSGLTSALVTATESPEHDYAAALTAAASASSIDAVPLDMEGLDDHLASVGWRPPTDALRRLAVDNDWLARRIDAAEEPVGRDAELAVFLLRERAVETLDEQEIVDVFERWGFEPLDMHALDEKTRDKASRVLRGGNWGRGPYPVSGGRPAIVLACIHHAPREVWPALRDRYPHLTNADVYLVKQELRELIEERVGPDAAFNAVHSADDEHEAWHYLEVVTPEHLGVLRTRLEVRAAGQTARDDVVTTLSRGRRARVDVIRTPAGPLVRKTYTDGAHRHVQREMKAMDALAGRVPAVPAIVDRGADWFTIPQFDDVLASMPRPLPLPLLRQMIGILRDIRSNGFVLVDAKPDNFVLDPREGLRIVDLEFAYPASGTDRTLDQGPEFVDPDRAAFRDIPAGDSSYEIRWQPHTGLPLSVLFHGTPGEQRLHRLRDAVRRGTVAPGSPLRARLRGISSVLRAAKARLRGSIARRAWGGRHTSTSIEGAPDVRP